jgi:hypothetical protein
MVIIIAVTIVLISFYLYRRNSYIAEQLSLIEKGLSDLEELADRESINDYTNQKHIFQQINSTCPNCKESNVVNKISNTNGSGSIRGTFFR